MTDDRMAWTADAETTDAASAETETTSYDHLQVGCYVEGARGQYAPDRFVEQFGTDQECRLMAAWRAEIESDHYDPMADDAVECRNDLCDEIESRVAAGLADGLGCGWSDGEFFVWRDCGADLWIGEACGHCGDAMDGADSEHATGLPIMDTRVGGGVIDCDCACHGRH